MSDIVKIFALGGLDENGKNMYVVEINDDIFVIEAGIKYPEKSMPGIDIIIPDYDYLIKNKRKVRAYIISHGHDDNMGSLTYVLKDVPAPVYCTKVTSEMIKYTAEKLKEDVKIDFRIVESTSEVRIANRKVNFFSTTHSVAQSMGIAIDTTQGSVVYTGDFIIDCGAPKHFRTDLKAITKIAENKVLCLLSESEGAGKPEFTSPKHKITPLIKRQIQENKNRLIVAMYSQNLFGIQEVINLGIENNKKILIFSSEMQSLIDGINLQSLLKIPRENQAQFFDLKKEDQSNLLILITGTGEKLFRILQRIANDELLEEKGLAFSDKDLLILAAPSTPGIEVIAIDTLDDLSRTGANILNISNNKISSMHAQEEDLKTMLSILNPKYYLPVGGYYKELVSNAQIASLMQIGLSHNNILVYDNGMVAKFKDERYVSGEAMIKVGEFMVDGLGIFDAGSIVINDRHKLGQDGALILGITVDYKTKEVIAGPDVQTRGLVFIKDFDYLLKEVAIIYEDVVTETFKNTRLDYNERRQIVREKVSRYIRKETGKDPMILSMIIEI